MEEIKSVQIRWATLDDVENLIAVRLAYLSADGAADTGWTAKLIANLRAYFTRHLSGSDFMAALAEDGDGHLVATAFLAVVEKPPGLSFPNGLTGMLMNVYTYPKFRRLGLATTLVRFITAEASARRLDVIDLLTITDRMRLYEQLGFVNIGYSPMRLQVVGEGRM